jgi:hypothetical protein
LPPGGWILVPSRTGGLVKNSSVLRSEEQLEKPCAESHLAPFGCGHVIRKVRCWLECGFANRWSRRVVCRTVSHLRQPSSLTWSGSYIALGYLVHGQLHWTLAQTLRPLLAVRVAVFLGRFWRRRSAHAAMLVLATIFFCALQSVSQHNAGLGMSARILHGSRVQPEFTIHGLKPFLILTFTSFWRWFRR